ncbi:MAG: porin family protein [Bacteroidales bacterium]|nr:porin family protein [Bacteroidales bacterium]
MKRRITYIVLSLIFLMIHVSSSGQKQKPKNDSSYDDKLLHFGFSLGVNTMDFNITPTEILQPLTPYVTAYLSPEVSKLKPGFNIQIITNLRVAKYFDIRFLPGIAFGQRTVKYYYEDDLDKIKVWGDSLKLNPAFLEFPLLLKFKGDRLNNVRPYVIGGLNYRYDLAAKKLLDGSPPYVLLKKQVLYYELGAGLDFYLTYFKLSVELKMSNGIGNVFVMERDPVHPQYSDAIDKMKSQIWILAFHFE